MNPEGSEIFDFHIDKVTQQEIAGWVAHRQDINAPVLLHFVVGGVVVGIERPRLPREDVAASGRGPRNCGFYWRIPIEVAALALRDDATIAVRATHGGQNVELARLRLSRDPVISLDIRAAIAPALDAAVVQSAVAALDRSSIAERTKPGIYPLHERMFSFQSTTRGTIDPAAMSPYVAFTHSRMRKEERFPLDGSQRARDHFLRWYIDEYSSQRAPKRTPLGADEIAYLNEPVSLFGVEYKISRASLSYALSDKDAAELLPIRDRDDYDDFVVWWCIKKARSLNMEDCLVPDYYVEAMRAMTTLWTAKDFPMSMYMLKRFDKDTDYHNLNLDNEQDRIIYCVWYLLQAAAQPDLVRYIPTKNLNALFDGEEGSTLFDRVVVGIQPGTPLNTRLYTELLRRRGFDLTRRRYLFRDARGNRFEAARFPPAAARDEEPVDLQLIGPLQKSSGLGQATRLSAQTLERAGYRPNLVDFGLDNPAPVNMHSQRTAFGKPHRARVNLLHLNGETVPIAFAYMEDVLNGAYNIGYFFWELSTPAPAQHLSFDFLDEIWVATEYGVSIYEPAVQMPVRNVGMAFEPMDVPNRDAARAYLAERLPVGPDMFVFMATFDSFSFLERKNPHGVLDAFRAAFGPDEDVLLVLKTHNRDFVIDRHQQMRWDRIVEIAASDPRIVILNETLRYSELMKLKRGADCYVSLHRSEGLGFGLVEAMALGTPVLTTGYSGNADFNKADNSWLVDFDLVEPAPAEYMFVSPGQVWGAPRLESAVKQMRAMRADGQERERRAKAAKAFVEQNYSLDAQAKKYKTRLREIFAALDRPGR